MDSFASITVAILEGQILSCHPRLTDRSSRASSYFKLQLLRLRSLILPSRHILITALLAYATRPLSASGVGGEASSGYGADSAAREREEEGEGV